MKVCGLDVNRLHKHVSSHLNTEAEVWSLISAGEWVQQSFTN